MLSIKKISLCSFSLHDDGILIVGLQSTPLDLINDIDDAFNSKSNNSVVLSFEGFFLLHQIIHGTETGV